METISAKQDSRIRSLRYEITLCKHRIHALLSHPDIVNTAIGVINQYLSQGVQWSLLQEQIAMFKQRSYNVFHHVKQLDLEHNRVKLEFPDDYDPSVDETDEETDEEINSETDDDNGTGDSSIFVLYITL